MTTPNRSAARDEPAAAAADGEPVCKLCGSSRWRRRYTLCTRAEPDQPFTAAVCATCGLFQDLYDWPQFEAVQRAEVAEFVETDPGELWESERELAAHRAKAEEFAAALDRIEPLRGKHVMEIGCRRGFFLRACLDLGASAVTGQEFFRSAPIEYAREQLGLTDVRTARFDDGAIWPDHEFDVVCSFDVLEHVHDVRALFAHLVRLTRPGGLQYHATPGFDSVSNRAGRFLATTGPKAIRPIATSLCNVQAPFDARGGPHVTLLARRQVAQLASEFKMDVVDVRYVNSYTYSNTHYTALVPGLNRLPPKVGAQAFGVVRRVIRNKLVFAAEGPLMLLIAGPCAIESIDVCRAVAATLLELHAARPELDVVFKSSFDKANRTSIGGYRGGGLDWGLEVLSQIKSETGLPVITDVHEPWQAKPVAEVADYVQVPAFLCRQTDLLLAAAATGRPVLVKKGQFLDPHNTARIVEKLRSGGCEDVLLGERGTTFGYGDLVVDFRSLVVMREPGVRIVYDATHSVQQPGALGASSGGQRQFVEPLARAAVAVGVDGLFFEVHPNPPDARSDGPNSLYLSELSRVVDQLLAIRAAADPPASA